MEKSQYKSKNMKYATLIFQEFRIQNRTQAYSITLISYLGLGICFIILFIDFLNLISYIT